MKFRYVSRKMGKVIFILFFLLQTTQAMMYFMPTEKLVDSSEYIVVAKVQAVKRIKTTSNSGKSSRGDYTTVTELKNELKVLDSLKGKWPLKKPLFLKTYQFDGWMEDMVELPQKGLNVLLFLKKNENGTLRPVNGIQGVWYMHNGEFTRIGYGTTLKQIRDLVQNQQNVCNSPAFTSLLDTAEIQTQAGHYKEALEAYRKAYSICPMRDLEEQMAWLLGEVGNE